MRSDELAQRYVETVLTTFQRDLELYTEDATRWHNTDEITSLVPRDQGPDELDAVVAAVPDLAGREVRIRSWDDGFTIQYALTGTGRGGANIRIPACIIGTVRDGKIAALEEYLDSAHVEPLRNAVLGDASMSGIDE